MLATLVSAGVALVGALAMRDRVRLVDIVSLFFGGVGAGAGLTALIIRRRQPRSDAAATASEPARHLEPPVPPTVPARETTSVDHAPTG